MENICNWGDLSYRELIKLYYYNEKYPAESPDEIFKSGFNLGNQFAEYTSLLYLISIIKNSQEDVLSYRHFYDLMEKVCKLEKNYSNQINCIFSKLLTVISEDDKRFFFIDFKVKSNDPFENIVDKIVSCKNSSNFIAIFIFLNIISCMQLRTAGVNKEPFDLCFGKYIRNYENRNNEYSIVPCSEIIPLYQTFLQPNIPSFLTDKSISVFKNLLLLISNKFRLSSYTLYKAYFLHDYFYIF